MKKFSTLFLLVILSLIVNFCFATSYTWTGNTSSNWATAGNWSPTGIPDSTDDATIPDSSHVSLTTNVSVNSFTLGVGATVDLQAHSLTIATAFLNGGAISNGSVHLAPVFVSSSHSGKNHQNNTVMSIYTYPVSGIAFYHTDLYFVLNGDGTDDYEIDFTNNSFIGGHLTLGIDTAVNGSIYMQDNYIDSAQTTIEVQATTSSYLDLASGYFIQDTVGVTMTGPASSINVADVGDIHFHAPLTITTGNGDLTFGSNAITDSAALTVTMNGGNIYLNDYTQPLSGSTAEFILDASSAVYFYSTSSFAGTASVNGGAVYGDGTVAFGNLLLTGSGNQTINQISSAPSFSNMEVNKSSGTVTLATPLTISNSLTLTKGVIYSDTINLLIIPDNGVTTGGSDSSFVYGAVEKIGDDAFIFPLGDDTLACHRGYYPIGISAPSSTSDIFIATYFAYDCAIPDTNTSDTFAVSNCEHWKLNHQYGSSNIIITLPWDSNSCYVGDTAELLVLAYDAWMNLGHGAVTCIGATGTITASSTLSIPSGSTYIITKGNKPPSVACASCCSSISPADSNNPEYPANTSSGLINIIPYMGNDSKVAVINPSLGKMEVSVWDDPTGNNYSAFNWNDGVHTPGNLNLGAGLFVPRWPDIALVESNSTWYAVVVYGIVVSGSVCDAYYDMYEWGYPNANTFSGNEVGSPTRIPDLTGSPNAQFIYNNTTGGDIRIDADAFGNFVIIWDDTNPYTGIQGIGGVRNGSGDPSLAAKCVQLAGDHLSQSFGLPDVSLLGVQCEAFTAPASTLYYVYVDYLNGNPDKLRIGKADFSLLYSGSGSNNYFYKTPVSFTSDITLSGRPRIACPACGCIDTWSVVYSQWNITTWINDIIGYTSYSSYPGCNPTTINGPNNYTDGICSGYQIDLKHNLEPAVSYTSDGSGIMVGWDTFCPNCYFVGGNVQFIPTQAIALNLNSDGSVLIPGCTTVPIYLAVTTNNVPSGAENIALSGRDYYSNKMEITYYGAPNNIKYKDSPYGTCALRTANTNSDNADNMVISPNPFSEGVTIDFAYSSAQIKIFDLTGNLLFSASGTESAINRSLNELAINLPKGVYILRLETLDGNDAMNKKFIKM